MVLGIAGGLMLGGMLAGAVTGSVVLLLIGCTAGLLIAGAAAAAKHYSELVATRHKLNYYPPYGY